MPDHKLSIKLKGSTRNVQSLVFLRGALKGCQESFGVVPAIISPCMNRTSLEFPRFHFFSNRQVIIGNTHRITGTLNFWKSLLKLNEVNPHGLFLVVRTDDTDRVSRIYLPIKQTMNLIEKEASMCRAITGIFQPCLVINLAALYVLVRTLRRKVEAGGSLTIDANINASALMIGKAKTQIDRVCGNFSSEVYGRVPPPQLNVGLLPCLDCLRIKHVVDRLTLIKRNDMGTIKPATLGLVTGIREGSAIGPVPIVCHGAGSAQSGNHCDSGRRANYSHNLSVFHEEVLPLHRSTTLRA